MDDIVKQALAKWPGVPHCYGWLGLDARGNWRMRDERAQRLNLPGDKIAHAALSGFINRNYAHDARGCWFFQNGPQRVYLTLEATPYIVRTDPAQGFVMHTGAPLGAIDAVFWCASGELILRHGDVVAQLDDRDMAQAMSALDIDGHGASDEALLAWLDGAAGALTLRRHDRHIPVQRIESAAVPARFGFQRSPTPPGM